MDASKRKTTLTVVMQGELVPPERVRVASNKPGGLVLKRVITAALAASLLSVSLPTQAQAVTTVTASASDVTVRYNDCKKSTITVDGDWANDYSNEIDIRVRKPNGRYFDSWYVSDDYSGVITRRTELCGWDKEGRYRVRVVAIGYDEFGDETSRVETSTHFRYNHIGKARSRVTRSVHWTGQGRYPYTVNGRVLRKGKGVDNARFKVQARIWGDWYQVGRGRANKQGRFHVTFKPNARVWRFVYPGNKTTKASTSDRFRTPFRNGRVSSEGEAPLDALQAGELMRSTS